MKIIWIALVVALCIFALAWASDNFEYFSFDDMRRAVAGVFFVESITEGELKEAYAKATHGEGKVLRPMSPNMRRKCAPKWLQKRKL